MVVVVRIMVVHAGGDSDSFNNGVGLMGSCNGSHDS